MKKQLLNDEEIEQISGGCQQDTSESSFTDILDLIRDLRNYAQERGNLTAGLDRAHF